MCGIFSMLVVETLVECQCFLMSSCQWGCYGGGFLLTLNRLHTLF